MDKVISAIDGLALKTILENSEGIDDLEEILDSLSYCEYGDMASCNIIYTQEMSC